MPEQTLPITLDNFTTTTALPRSDTPDFAFDSIPDVIAALQAGRAVVVVGDEDRESEGDLICAAEFATPAMINFMATHARGLICLAITGDRLDELHFTFDGKPQHG